MTESITPIIPLVAPDLSDVERQVVASVLKSSNLAGNTQVQALEEDFRVFTGSHFAVAVSSSAAALHLCVRTAGIGPGDLVITTPLASVDATNAILYEGATPIFVDVDPRTGNIAPDLVHQAASDLLQGSPTAQIWLPRQGSETPGRLKAILPVDLSGQPADLDPIRETANAFGLRVIEDASEALGSEYQGHKAGALGDMGVFGFSPDRQITTGEGGLIITQHEQDAERMRALRDQGHVSNDPWNKHMFLGYNYRMDELSAALGVAQMSRLEGILAQRTRVAVWYNERLKDVVGVEPLPPTPGITRLCLSAYTIRLAAGIKPEHVMRFMADLGIPTRPTYQPVHLQPYLMARFGFVPGDFEAAEDLAARNLSLPYFAQMSETQVDAVCDALSEALA